MDERAKAWAELHAATPSGWWVGGPGPRHGGSWTMYAFDQREKARIGRRSLELMAEAASELECLNEMVRRLREIGEESVLK